MFEQNRCMGEKVSIFNGVGFGTNKHVVRSANRLLHLFLKHLVVMAVLLSIVPKTPLSYLAPLSALLALMMANLLTANLLIANNN